jgi:hypothetical protein
LPAKFPVYPELLAAAGYHVGFTRKGWGPGKIQPGGRDQNPAGTQYENFESFLYQTDLETRPSASGLEVRIRIDRMNGNRELKAG